MKRTFRHKIARGRLVRAGVTLILLLAQLHCRETPTIRIAGNTWIGYEPLYLAESLGYFQKEIRLLDYPSASEVLRAYKNSNLEMAALTLDEVIYLQSEGFQGKIVLVCDISNGSDVVLGGPGIRRPADLRGKRIGVENTALGSYMLARFLEKNQMKAGEIEIVPVEIDSHEKYFLSGRVDAIITFDPVRSRLLSRGAHLIFDSSKIPGEIIDVVIVREDILKKYPQVVRHVTDTWYRSLEYIDSDFESAAEFIKKRTNIQGQSLRDAFRLLPLGSREINDSLLKGNPPRIRANIEKIAEVMIQNKIIERRPNPDNMLTDIR